VAVDRPDIERFPDHSGIEELPGLPDAWMETMVETGLQERGTGRRENREHFRRFRGISPERFLGKHIPPALQKGYHDLASEFIHDGDDRSIAFDVSQEFAIVGEVVALEVRREIPGEVLVNVAAGGEDIVRSERQSALPPDKSATDDYQFHGCKRQALSVSRC
jgi:hypothetical protein